MTTANGQTPAPFMQDAPAVISTLGTDAHQGLTSEQAAHNLNQYGPNAFTKPKPESMLSRIVKTAADPMLIMLMIAAAITLGVNITRAMAGGHADILECVGIFFAIALSVTITVVMEGRSAKAFEALNDINDDTTVTVVRDGEVTLVSQRDITIGDVLQISTGDKLPADARLIESNDLTADESALTGESVPSAKAADAVFTDPKTPVADRTNMLYSGCFVTAGNGRAVVTAVGDDTEFGKIARELRAANTGMTPLQEKLAKLGKVIAVVGSIVAALVFVLQVARFVASGTASFDTISEAFITSITLIVAAVPEGLPTIVAACLAVNIIKMSKQNALVKKMVACETIGCINVICSDKTGTLTQNRMTVIEAYNAPGRALEKPEQIRNRMLLENFCVNGTADVTFPGATEAEAGAMPEFIGNPTECALLVAAHKAGLDYRIRRERATVLHTYPFSSETKSMTTVVRDGDGITVFAKGSPEKMLDLCAVDAKTRGEIEREIAKFQAQSCRVLGFAHRHISDKDADTAALDYAADRAGLESGMMFDGFVAIVDPLREDVPGAVERCRKAGIELKMLTGDNIVTATAIANELDILDERHIAVEARQIEEMSDEELSREIGRIRVIARSTPVIKMRVVNALKAQGNVVAVTGDGINDAPAIKNADVGIAMGIAGTEVSKEASDIVMLDDSFATIVKAVHWGRGIYENFQRFIQFQLTVNLSSVVVVLASLFSGLAAPFTALQLLWVNIIMDGPPALTLGMEPIRDNLMDRRPTRRDAGIVSRGMLERIIVSGAFIAVVFMAQSWTNFMGGTAEQQSTILFTLFVVFQLFNAFNSRELGNASLFANLLRNKVMIGVFALMFALQVLVVQFGGAMFRTVPLPIDMWLKIIAVGFGVVVLQEVIKTVKRAAAAIRARRTANESDSQQPHQPIALDLVD